MTHVHIEKARRIWYELVGIIGGIATFVIYQFSHEIIFLYYSIICIVSGVLELIFVFRSKLNPQLWSDKSILTRIKIAEIFSLIFLLLVKIFVIDELNIPKILWFHITLICYVFCSIESIFCMFHMAVKSRELKKELIRRMTKDSENIDSQNIKVRMPGRLCAIFSYLLSTLIFIYLMDILAKLYCYPDILGTKENILTIWICAIVLGVSIYLGNRAKKKGYDCCFASSGISIGTAGLAVAVVLISLAQC